MPFFRMFTSPSISESVEGRELVGEGQLLSLHQRAMACFPITFGEMPFPAFIQHMLTEVQGRIVTQIETDVPWDAGDALWCASLLIVQEHLQYRDLIVRRTAEELTSARQNQEPPIQIEDFTETSPA